MSTPTQFVHYRDALEIWSRVADKRNRELMHARERWGTRGEFTTRRGNLGCNSGGAQCRVVVFHVVPSFFWDTHVNVPPRFARVILNKRRFPNGKAIIHLNADFIKAWLFLLDVVLILQVDVCKCWPFKKLYK